MNRQPSEFWWAPLEVPQPIACAFSRAENHMHQSLANPLTFPFTLVRSEGNAFSFCEWSRTDSPARYETPSVSFTDPPLQPPFPPCQLSHLPLEGHFF